VLADAESLPSCLVVLQPLAPDPIVKMIGRNGATERQTTRTGFLHEIGEVSFELGEELARGGDAEHKRLVNLATERCVHRIKVSLVAVCRDLRAIGEP
jgi:hypothetical protein